VTVIAADSDLQQSINQSSNKSVNKSVGVVCNAAGVLAGRPPGAWAADTARQASTVTSRSGDTLLYSDEPRLVQQVQ